MTPCLNRRRKHRRRCGRRAGPKSDTARPRNRRQEVAGYYKKQVVSVPTCCYVHNAAREQAVDRIPLLALLPSVLPLIAEKVVGIPIQCNARRLEGRSASPILYQKLEHPKLSIT